MHISFTGPRKLTKEQEKDIYKDLEYIANKNANWHVGDARGLDKFVRQTAKYYNKNLTVYEVEGYERWHFAERSKRMVDAIADLPDAWLYGFPNKPCPGECKPRKNPNGNGSGTWLTIAYAKYRGLQIYLLPQTKFDMPDWLKEPKAKQLSLF